mmetsp:Transcript_1948/g.3907  ORF Transcript_1948/g.3907 Transcript_1948/m.3907 type:complete len:387 (+) Transcript_1948:38-1198(+)
MAKQYAPSIVQIAANNWECIDMTDNFIPSNETGILDNNYINNCPTKMGCWYDAEYDYANRKDEDGNDVPSCHCGGVWIGSQEDHPNGTSWVDGEPYCMELSEGSFLPIIICVLNIITCAYCIGKGFYLVYVLKKLKQFQMNDITEALVLAIIGVTFMFLHQTFEFVQMMIRSESFHETVYTNGGLLQWCLGGLGLCQVLSSLKIPLLWLMIASSGMNKAEAAKNKKRVGKFVNYASGFFFISFIGIMLVMGSAFGGMYAILWMIVMLGVFYWGSSKLAKQLIKPGEDVPKGVKDMRFYVKRFTALVIMYILAVGMYFINSSNIANSNPENWAMWAVGVYHILAQLYVSNLIYIRASLDKKLKKFRETGKVTPSTTVSSSSTSSSTE